MTDIVDELRARALQGRFNLEAADEIERLRAELSEQCRLLGMSGEREAKHLAQIAALEKERDNANQRYSSAVRLLAGIHALLYPPRLAGHDGRTWQFKSPLAEEQMQELSDRIRALPDEIARSALEE